jgi:sulfite reductase (NADPH) flavoprotein alpha-component
MSRNLPPPIPALLPDSAPFTPEQRAWLNGFFAGYLGLDNGGVTALSPEESAKLMSGVATAAKGPLDDGDDGEAPWHDQTMPLADRMKLAEGRPLRRRMMAAMGQQDCGQCGYTCEDYSNALFLKNEERLNLCVPGGKDTLRMLKKLGEELAAVASPATVPAEPRTNDAEPPSAPTPQNATGYSRDNPVEAVFRKRTRLNKPGSNKETWHIDIDLIGSALDYTVGDSFGISPANDPGLVDAVIRAIGAPANFPIGGRTLREVLSDGVSLSPAPDMLFQLFSYLTGGERRVKAKALAAGEDPDGDAATLDVLAGIEKFLGVLAQGRARSRLAHRRCGALRRQGPPPARRRVDLLRRAHQAR